MSKLARRNRWTGWTARQPSLLRPFPVLGLELLEVRETPATFRWSGLGDTPNWSNPGNWEGNAAPTGLPNLGGVPNPEDLVFPNRPEPNARKLAVNNITPGGNPGQFNSIAFDGDDFTLSGASLILGGFSGVSQSGALIASTGSVNNTVAMDLRLFGQGQSGNFQTFRVSTAADVTISGRLEAPAGSTLTKDEPGTLVMSGNNLDPDANYTGFGGTVRLNNNGGELVVAHAKALGTDAAGTVVGSGAAVRVRGVAGTITEPITLNGRGPANDGALSVLAGSTTWAGGVLLDSDAGFGASAGAVLNVTGVVRDSSSGFSLYKDGAGEVRLASPTGNTYRQQTIVNDGVLTATHPRSLGADSTALSGTVVNFGLTQAGQLRLAAPAGTPGFTIRDEFITLNGPGRDDLANKGALTSFAGDNYWAGPVTLGSPLPNAAIAASVGAADGASLTVSGVVASPNGPFALVKLDTGRVVLDNQNLYTGTTLVAEGALRIRDSKALGTVGGLTGVEAQAIRVFGNSGTFTVIFGLNGDLRQTPDLPAGASAQQVEAAINALSSVGGLNPPGRVSVTKTPTDGGSQYTILFGGAFVGQNVPQILSTTTGAAGSNVFTVRDGGGSAVAVLEGASLELDVEASRPTEPQTDAHGRNLGNDSVTGDPNRLHVSEPITIFGRGLRNTGALRSVSGINRYLAPIELGAAVNVADAVGVDQDLRTGHPTPDLGYFTNDYSLTTAFPIVGNVDPDLNLATDFVKRGAGHLILPVANTYLGVTRVEEGWVTVQNNASLGGRTAGTTQTSPSGSTYLLGYGDAAQPPTVVSPGAAVHLRPLVAGTNLSLTENFTLAGVGPAHPYNFINSRGALMNLDGNNVLSGDVGLAGQAGIGVEQVVPASRSDLVVTGTLRDGRNTFNLNANGGQAEQRFVLETGAATGRVIVTYDFFTVPDRLVAYYPPQADGGAIIFDTGIIGTPGGPRQSTFTFGPGASTRVELVMNPGGNANPGTVWELSAVSEVEGGLVKFGSKRLNLQGEGTYSGLTEVREGTLRAQNDTALGREFSGTATTQGSYTQTDTVVSPAAVLEVTGGIDRLNGGIAAGTQVYYEKLSLNNTGLQVAVAGSLVPNFVGRFTLVYDRGTGLAADVARYTFPITATAAEVQTALNAATDSDGRPGLLQADFPAATTGGVTVTRPAGSNVYTVLFGNVQSDGVLSAATAGRKSLTATASDGGEVTVSGGPASLVAGLPNRTDDNAWRGPVSLSGSSRVEVAARSRLTLFGAIDDTSATRSDLAKRGGGELLLAGANSHRGLTSIDEGIVTAANSAAFGTTDGTAATGTVVKRGAQLQLQGSLTVAGEQLTMEGAGPGQAPAFEGTVRWLNVGPASTNNGTAGNNLPTSGRVTSVVSDPSDSNVIYVATAGGGAWKTKDGGRTWNPLFDLAPDSAGFIFGGSFAVSLSDPRVVYFATGEANGYVTGNPIPGQPANYAGSGVYKSTDSGLSWALLTGAGAVNPLAGQAVSKIIVDPEVPDRIYVASGTSNTLNADPNAVPGVWRHDGSTWVNLTGGASPSRLNSQQGQAPYNPANLGPPGTPGPDDDFRILFPQSNAFWSDIALVKRNSPLSNPAGTPTGTSWVLYAALGESTQRYFVNQLPTPIQAVLNGVYRTEDPDNTTTHPTWWLGNGSAFPLAGPNGPVIPGGPVPPPTVPDRRAGNAFPVGSVTPAPPPPGRNGWIKLAATLNNFVQPGGFVTNYVVPGLINAHISVYASIVRPDWADQKGQLFEIQRSGWDGGINTQWQKTTGDPAQPFGTATWDTTILGTYRNIISGSGRYNHAIAVRSYSPLASVEQSALQNQDVVYIAGQNGMYRSTDGGQNWALVPADAAGNRPADQYHALSFDFNGRLLIGTDGGVYRYDPTGAAATFTNLNGDLATVQLNSADAHPTDLNQALVGAADNGTQQYTGGLAWSQIDKAGGSNTGVVRYDPRNPQVAYAVRDGRLRKTTDGGATWATIRDVSTAATGTNLNWALVFDPWFRYQAFNLPNIEPFGSAGTVGKVDYYDRNDALNYFPLVLDKVNPDRLLIGDEKAYYVGNPLGAQVSDILTNSLFESSNGGSTWTNLNAGIAVSAIGLATFQGPFALDPVPNVLGNSPPGFPNVTDKGANSYDPDTIYAAGYAQSTDFEQTGRREELRVTKDRGTSWVVRTPPGATPTDPAPITSITVDPRNRDIVYVTRNRRAGEPGGRVFRSLDAGRTWDDITGNDPDMIAPAWTTVVDPRTGTLYLGNDSGVWSLPNASETTSYIWTGFGAGLPRASVRDLVLNQTLNTLTAATHGRGMFQLLLTDYQVNAGALRAISGSSVWTGNVRLTGNTTVGASGSQALQNGQAAAAINIIGRVSDLPPGGNFELKKVGLGTLTLSGVNTYGGQTVVQEGVLQVNNPRALGASTPAGSANTVVTDGAALELRSDLEAEPVTVNGRGFQFNARFTGALRSVSGFNTYTGTLTLATDSTIGVDSGSTLTVGPKTGLAQSADGPKITDNGAALSIDKESPGTLVLATANEYGGLTTVAGGALQVQDAGALGGTAAGTRVLDGAQLQIARKANTQAPTVVAGEALTLSGSGITDGGALRNVHTGDPTGSTNEWQGPITFRLDPNSAPPTVPSSQVAIGVSDPADTLLLSGPIDQVNSQTSFGLVKVGPGRLALGQANSYTGVTNVNAGTLSVRDPNALGPRLSYEVQTVAVVGSVDPATGKSYQFTLAFNGQETGLLDASTVTASVVRSKLGALSTIGGVNNILVAESPTSNGKTFTISFRPTVPGTTTNPDLPALVAGNVSPGLKVDVAEAQKGGRGTVVAAGATLELDAGSPAAGFAVDEVLALNGDGVGQPTGNGFELGGALRSAAGANTYSGPVTLESDASVGAAAGSTLTVTGVIRDLAPVPVPAPRLRKAGEGIVVLQSTNPYAGLTVVDNGVLRVRDPQALGFSGPEIQRLQITGTNGNFTLTFKGQRTGNLLPTISASALQAALVGLSTIGQNGLGQDNVTVAPSLDDQGNPLGGPGNAFFDVTFARDLAGADQPLLVPGATGDVAVFPTTRREGPGATVVNAGATLQVAGGITMNLEAVTINGPGFGGQGALNNFSGDNVWAAPLALGSDASVGTTTPTQVFSFVAPITDNKANPGRGLDIVGPGTVSYDGTTANDYTGTTTITNGTLRLNKTGAALNKALLGPLVVGGGADPAVARLAQDNQIADAAPVTVRVNGTFDGNGKTETVQDLSVTAGGAVFTGAGGALTARDVAVTDGAITVGANGSLAARDVTMTGGTITAAANAAVGLRNLNTTGGAVVLAGGAALTFAPGGAITATSTATAPATISGPGALNLNGAARTVTVNDGPQAEDLRVTAVPSAGANDSLVKRGAGRLVLAPTAPNGVPVRVEAGDLQVDGDAVATPPDVGAVTLTGGSLSGTGSVGSVGGDAGPAVGTVSPGDNGRPNPVGTLRTSGNVVWGAGTTFAVNLDASAHPNPAAGTDYDQHAIGGSIALGGATLTGTFGQGILFGDRFTVITAAGGVSGKFAQTNGADVVFIQGQKFRIIYTSTTVELEKVRADVTIGLGSSRNPSTLRELVTFTATVTPEPGAGAIPTADTVTFTIDGVSYGPFTLDANGQVTLTTAAVPGGFLAGGPHTVGASFSGDALNFNPAAATPFTQTVEVPAIAPLVGGPPLISPNNSPGTLDTFSASTTVTQERAATTWRVEVKAASVSGVTAGTVVRTFTGAVGRKPSPGADNSFPIAVTWDGRPDPDKVGQLGLFVADGDYTVTASFLDEFGNTTAAAPITVRVDNTNPTVTPPASSVAVIAPAPQGLPPGTASQVPTGTRVTGAVGDANLDFWTLRVLDAGGAEVRRYTGPAGQAAVDVTWDGRNAGGGAVPNGVYSLVVTAKDRAGNEFTPLSPTTVVVLNTPPTVTLASNGPTTYGQSITFTATVALPVLAPPLPPALADRLPRPDGSVPPVEVRFFNGTTLLGTGVLARDAADGRYKASVTVPTFNAGTYDAITATYPGTTDFLPSASARFTHVVVPAVLSVTAANATKVYGQPVPPLTYSVSGLVNGDVEAAVVSGQLATPATEASPVGSYPILQGTVTTNANYTVRYTAGSLTVTPAPLTILVNDATRVFNRANPPFTASYEGLLLGDTPAAAVQSLELVTTAGQGSKPGPYPITARGTPTARNYTLTVIPGTLTITPIPSEIAVGTGPGSSVVKRYDPDGKPFGTLTPFGDFAGGVRTATADFNGDGIEDVVVGTGPGTQARVVVIDGNNDQQLLSIFPFEGFTGGVFVTAGDLTGDGRADLVVTPDEGGGPQVRIYRGGDFAPVVSFFGIQDPNFRGGVRAAVGDVNADGFADLAVSAGFGGGPRVALWDGKALVSVQFKPLVNDFFAFSGEDATRLRNGVYVALGDLDGDGYADVVAGAGPGGGPRVVAISGKTLLTAGPAAAVGGPTASSDGGGPLANFFAGNTANRGGVRVAVENLDGDLKADLVVGDGDGAGSHVTAYLGKSFVGGNAPEYFGFDAYPGFLGGVYVG